MASRSKERNIHENSSDHNIDNYHIGKVIGKGTFGMVKEATHILIGEKVSIKLILGSNQNIRKEEDR